MRGIKSCRESNKEQMQYECEALYDEQIRDNIRVNSEEMVVHDDIKLYSSSIHDCQDRCCDGSRDNRHETMDNKALN